MDRGLIEWGVGVILDERVPDNRVRLVVFIIRDEVRQPVCVGAIPEHVIFHLFLMLMSVVIFVINKNVVGDVCSQILDSPAFGEQHNENDKDQDDDECTNAHH